MDINDRIKARRKQLELDVDFIVGQLGISRATYYRYESKDIEKLPVSILVPLAKVLRVTPAYLMGWEELPEAEELSPEELALIKKYRQLDADGKRNIDRQIDFELFRMNKEADEPEEKDGALG